MNAYLLGLLLILLLVFGVYFIAKSFKKNPEVKELPAQ